MIELTEVRKIYTMGDQEVRALDGVDLRKRAQVYLMKAQGTDAEKEKLREQLEDQARQMAEMREQMQQFMAGQPAPKNKGGRPTNAERAAREAAKAEAAAE